MPMRILNALSDHADSLLSKVIHYSGIAAVSGTVTNGAINKTFTERLTTPDLWSIQDFCAIVGMFVALTLMVQAMVNIYLSIKKSKNQPTNEEAIAMAVKIAMKISSKEQKGK